MDFYYRLGSGSQSQILYGTINFNTEECTNTIITDGVYYVGGETSP